jgi:hypothetical protein
VIVECQEALVPLFLTAEGVNEVIPAGMPLPPFDYHLPLLSCPGVMGTMLETIPGTIPYLATDPRRSEIWIKRMEFPEHSLRVGLVWAGNPNHKDDRYRSIPLADFERLTGMDGVCFVGLQKGVGEVPGIAAGGDRLFRNIGDSLEDFADTAAALELFDLVISVDTAVAHLAGALGRQVWMLVPFAPDWRWLLDRRDSPWYPTMRMYRQKRPECWGEVIDEVASDLRWRAAQGRTGLK